MFRSHDDLRTFLLLRVRMTILFLVFWVEFGGEAEEEHMMVASFEDKLHNRKRNETNQTDSTRERWQTKSITCEQFPSFTVAVLLHGRKRKMSHVSYYVQLTTITKLVRKIYKSIFERFFYYGECNKMASMERNIFSSFSNEKCLLFTDLNLNILILVLKLERRLVTD